VPPPGQERLVKDALRVKVLRGPGESYSDVIVRLASSPEPRHGQNPVARQKTDLISSEI
jgi:hypothetical protein